MQYTNIYPVFLKMKQEKHLIFEKGNVLPFDAHVTVHDYNNIKDGKLLNERINSDIKLIVESSKREDDVYVYVRDKAGNADGQWDTISQVNNYGELVKGLNDEIFCLTKKIPKEETYLVYILCGYYKYLFVKSKDIYILINYEKRKSSMCYKGVHFKWEYLPQISDEYNTKRFIGNKLGVYCVNTFESFCSYCSEYNNSYASREYCVEFFDILARIFDLVAFEADKSYYYINGKLENKCLRLKFVRISQMIIVIDLKKDENLLLLLNANYLKNGKNIDCFWCDFYLHKCSENP